MVKMVKVAIAQVAQVVRHAATMEQHAANNLTAFVVLFAALTVGMEHAQLAAVHLPVVRTDTQFVAAHSVAHQHILYAAATLNVAKLTQMDKRLKVQPN